MLGRLTRWTAGARVLHSVGKFDWPEKMGCTLSLTARRSSVALDSLTLAIERIVHGTIELWTAFCCISAEGGTRDLIAAKLGEDPRRADCGRPAEHLGGLDQGRR